MIGDPEEPSAPAAGPDAAGSGRPEESAAPIAPPVVEEVAAPPRPPRIWPVFVTFGGAVVVLFFIAAVVLAVVFGVAPDGDMSRYTSLPALLVSSLITDAVLIGAALVAARPFTAARLGLAGGWGTPGELAAAAGGTVALGWMLQFVIAVLEVPVEGTLQVLSQAIESASGPSLLATVAVFGLLTGVAEEMFFRGFMQTRLAARWRPWLAVLVASACFAAMHFDRVHSPLAFVLGLWLGFLALRTNVRLAIVGHITNNTAAALLGAASISKNVFAAAAAVLVFAGAAALLGRRR
jgi:membrane protease YdiL (CAAX protease family)